MCQSKRENVPDLPPLAVSLERWKPVAEKCKGRDAVLSADAGLTI